jgi:hypothetical protein
VHRPQFPSRREVPATGTSLRETASDPLVLPAPERWWGPPTGPNGERAYGWLRITDGEPLDREDTTHTVIHLEEADGTIRGP